MKKILILLLSITLSSCYYTDRKINLNLEKTHFFSTNSQQIDVKVYDLRPDSSLLGKKIIGENSYNLSSAKKLSEMLQKHINEELNKDKFISNKRNKSIELTIEEFDYVAKRRFFIGKSSVAGKIKAVVKDKEGKTTFTKNFELSQKNKHFIVPLDATDEKTINQTLSELVNDILSDKSLKENLYK